jgi:hypothetical protein
MTLVKFVKDKDADSRQRRALLHLTQQNALGNVKNAGIPRGDILEPILKADFAAKRCLALLGHASCQ